MARPETLADIEIDQVEFGTVDVSKIGTDGTLLKAYGAFLEALQKAGNVEVKTGYSGVTLYRAPSLPEQLKQLESAQYCWDSDHKLYEQWAAGEEMDAEYKLDTAKRHARENDLPMFTWDRYGKTDADLDDTLAKIEELENA